MTTLAAIKFFWQKQVKIYFEIFEGKRLNYTALQSLCLEFWPSANSIVLSRQCYGYSLTACLC
jgi:hypothetical protein